MCLAPQHLQPESDAVKVLATVRGGINGVVILNPKCQPDVIRYIKDGVGHAGSTFVGVGDWWPVVVNSMGASVAHQARILSVSALATVP